MSSDVLLRLFGQTEVLIIAGTLINRDDILIFVLNKLDLLRSEKKIFFFTPDNKFVGIFWIRMIWIVSAYASPFNNFLNYNLPLYFDPGSYITRIWRKLGHLANKSPTLENSQMMDSFHFVFKHNRG